MKSQHEWRKLLRRYMDLRRMPPAEIRHWRWRLVIWALRALFEVFIAA